MPNYVKTKVIEDSLLKIDELEKELIKQRIEISQLRKELEAERIDRQNRLSSASLCLKSE